MRLAPLAWSLLASASLAHDGRGTTHVGRGLPESPPDVGSESDPFLPAGDAPKGRLVIVGGGSIPESVPRHALELAGGPDASVLIVPQASAQPDAGKSSTEMWKGAGASKVSILDLADPAAALASVRGASLIWMGGGDQNRLVKALAGTGLPEAIRARYVEGAVVGGTSAGAAAMSKAMITGEADLESVTGGATEIVEGLALWPEVIVDQHFLKRRRFNRLLGAVLDRPELVGVGIDEGTAVIVADRSFVVEGRGNAVVVDARKADPVRAKKGDPSTGVGLAVHVLADGMRYHLDRGLLPK
ncbi:MAG: cyanophycinase [Planctomycetes bacterium]|nr:cyanophycinase [Planctomycetota bacterium]